MHAAPADSDDPLTIRAAAAAAGEVPRGSGSPNLTPCMQISTDSGSSSALCISAIIPGGDPRSIILGNNFMRSWFTVYTYDVASRAAHVGFGAAAAMASSKRCGRIWTVKSSDGCPRRGHVLHPNVFGCFQELPGDSNRACLVR